MYRTSFMRGAVSFRPTRIPARKRVVRGLRETCLGPGGNAASLAIAWCLLKHVDASPFSLRSRYAPRTCSVLIQTGRVPVLLRGGDDVRVRPRMMLRVAGRVLEALGGRDAGFVRGRLAHLLPPVVVASRTGVIGGDAAGAGALGRRPETARRAPRRRASRLQPRVRSGTRRDPQRRPRPGSDRRGGRAPQWRRPGRRGRWGC